MLEATRAAPSWHPLVAGWFRDRFAEPTAAQARGWPPIQAGRDTLIAAPTGSGKTLAAFLACLDDLVRRDQEGRLDDRTAVLYVSPLRALAADIRRNLEEPLAEIAGRATALGLRPPAIRVALRTGDSSAAERQRLVRRPPHLLVTTPESLYLLLTAERGRALLATVRTVIIDEIHAVARDKRGAHLALSLERLDALCGARAQRIGLSATQRPIAEIGRFLVGSERIAADGTPDCAIVDEGHRRALDLGVEVPDDELAAVASKELWSDVFDRIATLAGQERTTLVFVNTRRLVERVSHALAERLGADAVAAHHGSLSQETRLAAEERLKRGDLRLVVATASLELGIDVGAVGLVCQIGSPRALHVGLQRIGRSGHFLGGVPKGRLFPLTRDDLLECAAFVRAARAGQLEESRVPRHPLDVLAQQVVAMAACEPLAEDDLLRLVHRAWPYAALSSKDFDAVVTMLAEGIATRRGRGRAHLHRDGVNRIVRGRRGARLAALTSGGAIPDNASYAVVLEPEGLQIGTLDEDFAVESMAGDIFLLGNSSWRIRRVESGRVRVEDAHGAPPQIPFWNGEAPGRSAELSRAVAALRGALEPLLDEPDRAVRLLVEECAVAEAGAQQAVAYLAAARAALGALPTQETLVVERFFDEAGGMQLVLHAPFGARQNRAHGLALRKRFCRSFDFELQAAATDDAILLSLGPDQSFPLESIFDFLVPAALDEILTQAALGAPMFGIRWRWNATRALALLRYEGGRKVPPPIQRMRSDDLLAAVFPSQVACQENVTYPIEIPDHPLVAETLYDCLHEAMDADGLRALLERMAAGAVRRIARDLPEPSPLAHEILHSSPYTFLDDAPLEERRARAVQTRRGSLLTGAESLGALDPAAIAEVAEQAFPDARDAEEVHDALLTLWFLPAAEVPIAWRAQLDGLRRGGRAFLVEREGGEVWIAAERRAAIERADDDLAPVRGWMSCLGPTTCGALSRRLGLPPSRIEVALLALEDEGAILRGRFSPDATGASELEWCDRTLLARIHRQTLGRLRREIEPVATADLLRFFARFQHVHPETRLRGAKGVAEVLGQLQGLALPAGAWEREVLPARIERYEPDLLDRLCFAGEVVWGRLQPSRPEGEREGPVRRAPPTRNGLVTIVRREDLPWLLATSGPPIARETLGGAAGEILDLLEQRGAMFRGELQAATRRLPTEVERSLWELVAAGLVTCDGFGGLRRLAEPSGRRAARARAMARYGGRARAIGDGGRWTLLRAPGEPSLERPTASGAAASTGAVEALALQYLRRWGVVFRDLLLRESHPPPWRELLGVYRRLEMRGELRGGRFVAGFAGEQFALPAAVEGLRSVRRAARSEPDESGRPVERPVARPVERIELCAADPLNLVGLLTPGPRLAPLLGQRFVLEDGVPRALARSTARRESVLLDSSAPG